MKKSFHPFRKKWGQNFLNDNNLLNKIVKTLNPLSHDTFLEIGAGYKNIGFTNFLLMVKTKFGLSVAYAYEFGIPNGQAAVSLKSRI